MTEIVGTYSVHSLPVNELHLRYDIGKSSFYQRVAALGMEFEKRGIRSIASVDQIDRLDALHDYLKTRGNTIEEFMSLRLPGANGQLVPIQPDITTAVLTLASAFLQQKPVDPLGHIRCLKEICKEGYLIPTHELKDLLRRKTITGDSIRAYSFVCLRTKLKQSGCSLWQISEVGYGSDDLFDRECAPVETMNLEPDSDSGNVGKLRSC